MGKTLIISNTISRNDIVWFLTHWFYEPAVLEIFYQDGLYQFAVNKSRFQEWPTLCEIFQRDIRYNEALPSVD